MTNIELVIKIPEDVFKRTVFYREFRDLNDYVTTLKALEKAVLLPKGHGDLKDMGNLQYIFDLTRDDPIYSGKDIEQAIRSMKSIIKADKTESESF